MPIMYRDIADMINKRKFKIIVNETYQPVIHPVFLQDGAPPPVCNPGPMDEGNKCITMLPISFIIDMVVNGVEFALYERDDVFVITELLRMYIATYKDILAISKDAEQLSFMKNAETTYAIMKERVDRRKRQEHVKAPTNLVDILLSLCGGGSNAQ